MVKVGLDDMRQSVPVEHTWLRKRGVHRDGRRPGSRGRANLGSSYQFQTTRASLTTHHLNVGRLTPTGDLTKLRSPAPDTHRRPRRIASPPATTAPLRVTLTVTDDDGVRTAQESAVSNHHDLPTCRERPRRPRRSTPVAHTTQHGSTPLRSRRPAAPNPNAGLRERHERSRLGRCKERGAT